MEAPRLPLPPLPQFFKPPGVLLWGHHCCGVNPSWGERTAHGTELSGGSKFPPGAAAPAGRTEPSPHTRPAPQHGCSPGLSASHLSPPVTSRHPHGHGAALSMITGTTAAHGGWGQPALQAEHQKGLWGHPWHGHNHPTPHSWAGARRFGQGTPQGVSPGVLSTCCRGWSGSACGVQNFARGLAAQNPLCKAISQPMGQRNRVTGAAWCHQRWARRRHRLRRPAWHTPVPVSRPVPRRPAHANAVSPCRTSPTHARPTRPMGPGTWHTLSPRLCVIPARGRLLLRRAPPASSHYTPIFAADASFSPKTPFFVCFLFFPLPVVPAPWWEEGWEGVNHLSPPLPPWPKAVPALGRALVPFSPPPGAAPGVAPWLDPAQHHRAALCRGKEAEKEESRPSSPPAELLSPCALLRNKKKIIHSSTHHLGHGTGHRPRVEAHLGRCHRMAWSTSGDFRGVCGAQHPLHVP